MTKKLVSLLPLLFCILFFEITGKTLADTSTQTIKAVAPNADGLVARYEFEGKANDVSGVNHGTSYGNPTYVAGVSGKGINLDGDGDYVNCGKASCFDLVNQITVTAWIKVDKFEKMYQTIISKGDNSWRLARAGKSNRIEFACNGTAANKWNGTGEVPWAISGTTNVNDDKWHHIAGVFDGSGLYLYINGVLEAAKGAAKSIDISSHNVLIGANAQVPGREWKGLIEDVRIYNYALSQAEIVSVMGKSDINLPEPVPVTLYSIAKKYDGLKKREEAKGVCQLILQKYPDSPFAGNAQIYISKREILSLIQSKEFTTAKAEYDNLIADFNDHPDLAEALSVIAQAYSPPRKFKEAESVYRQLIQLFPDSPYAIEARFRAPKIHVFYLIKSEQHTEAQAAIDKFVIDFLDHPATPGILYWFAKEYEASKTYDKAKSIYQKVIFEYPAASHTLKAELKVPKMDVMSLIESGNDSAAVTAVDSLIADFQDHADLTEEIFTIGEEYFTKAMKLDEQNKKGEAIECFRKALAVWGKIVTELSQSKSNFNAHTYYFSGYCYSRLNEIGKAIQYYQKVVDDWPKFEFAWHAQLRIARCYDTLATSGGISKKFAAPRIRQACQKLLANYPKSKGVEEATELLERWDSAENSQ